MDLLLGALLFLAGLVVAVWSVHLSSVAAPDRRIPPFRATLKRPLKATILQVLAITLSISSGLLLGDVLGFFAGLTPLLVGVAWLVAVVLHNRQVKHNQRQQKASTP